MVEADKAKTFVVVCLVVLPLFSQVSVVIDFCGLLRRRLQNSAGRDLMKQLSKRHFLVTNQSLVVFCQRLVGEELGFRHHLNIVRFRDVESIGNFSLLHERRTADIDLNILGRLVLLNWNLI